MPSSCWRCRWLVSLSFVTTSVWAKLRVMPMEVSVAKSLISHAAMSLEYSDPQRHRDVMTSLPLYDMEDTDSVGCLAILHTRNAIGAVCLFERWEDPTHVILHDITSLHMDCGTSLMKSLTTATQKDKTLMMGAALHPRWRVAHAYFLDMHRM